MLGKLSPILAGGLGHNILALYGVQFVRKLLPLITVPYLARVLGVEGWGLVAFFQGLGEVTIMCIEYGFSLSATREIARTRSDHDRRAEIVSAVAGAGVALAGIATFTLAALAFVLPQFSGHTSLLTATLVWATAQGLNPLWYFQGMERLPIAATLEVVGKILGAAGIFVLVKSPADAWKVLALQALAPALSTLLGFWIAYQETVFRVPDVSMITSALRTGWPMFLTRSAEALYSGGNSFVLGMVASPKVVAYYSGPQKISIAFFGLLNPIRDALYPKMSHLGQHSRAEAAHIARVGLIVIGAGGVALGLVLFATAPILIHLLMGSGFEPAVPVLRVLSLIPPVVALTNVFGVQWMLPIGLDKPFNTTVVAGALTNIALAILIAPKYGAVGMAWTVVASQSAVAAALFALLNRRGLNPISYARSVR